MTEETKILRENIKNFRHLITEGVSETDIAKYINNHEYVYIYYGGDDGAAKGSRTIRPYVLGTSKAGFKVLRAWQDRGSSHTFANKPTRDPSEKHDYWIDDEGSKPGWRMFRLDKISKIYPIGKKFNDSRGGPLIPAGYHEGGDDDMVSIDAYVSTKDEPDFEYRYKKDFEGDIKSRTDQRKAKWDSIRRGNRNSRKITADDVVKLRDIASRVFKKAHGSLLVTIDDRDNFQLVSVKDSEKQNIPDIAVVGSLPQLYDSLVNANKTPDDGFFKSKLSQTQQELKEELPTIPYKKTTFFK